MIGREAAKELSELYDIIIAYYLWYIRLHLSPHPLRE